MAGRHIYISVVIPKTREPKKKKKDKYQSMYLCKSRVGIRKESYLVSSSISKAREKRCKLLRDRGVGEVFENDFGQLRSVGDLCKV